jgi:hypothetical protein
LESGYPFSIFGRFDYNGDFSGPDWPNLVNKNAPRKFSRSAYISGNTLQAAWFGDPPVGMEGDVERNSFRGPGYANTNVSLMKNNHIPWFVGNEGAQLQIRAEFYNVFNRVNLDGRNWDTGVASNTFGRINGGVFYPRTTQISMRIEF